MLHSFLVYQSDNPVFLDNTNYFYTTLYFDPCIAATVANDVATANVISKSGSATKKIDSGLILLAVKNWF